MQELEKILEEMKEIKDGNRKEKLYAKYPPNSKKQEILNAYSQGYEDGTDNFYNAVLEIIRKYMSGKDSNVPTNDGWISVEERLPEENTAERYIITDTGGCIWSEMWYGYVEESDHAPCFYLWDDDMWQCLKIHAIAWRPLPEPYRPEGRE